MNRVFIHSHLIFERGSWRLSILSHGSFRFYAKLFYKDGSRVAPRGAPQPQPPHLSASLRSPWSRDLPWDATRCAREHNGMHVPVLLCWPQ